MIVCEQSGLYAMKMQSTGDIEGQTSTMTDINTCYAQKHVSPMQVRTSKNAGTHY